MGTLQISFCARLPYTKHGDENVETEIQQIKGRRSGVSSEKFHPMGECSKGQLFHAENLRARLYGYS